jgi:hypothetical protein
MLEERVEGLLAWGRTMDQEGTSPHPLFFPGARAKRPMTMKLVKKSAGSDDITIAYLKSNIVSIVLIGWSNCRAQSSLEDVIRTRSLYYCYNN